MTISPSALAQPTSKPSESPSARQPNRSLPAEEVEAQKKLQDEFDEKEKDLGGAKDEAHVARGG